MEDPIGESDDARLRQLLDVEQRLQELVRAAKDNAARRVAAARLASERRQAAAREAAERANAERANAERLVHEQRLRTIEADHRAAFAAIANVSDRRIDELARLALAHAIADPGETT